MKLKSSLRSEQKKVLGSTSFRPVILTQCILANKVGLATLKPLINANQITLKFSVQCVTFSIKDTDVY